MLLAVLVFSKKMIQSSNTRRIKKILEFSSTLLSPHTKPLYWKKWIKKKWGLQFGYNLCELGSSLYHIAFVLLPFPNNLLLLFWYLVCIQCEVQYIYNLTLHLGKNKVTYRHICTIKLWFAEKVIDQHYLIFKVFCGKIGVL